MSEHIRLRGLVLRRVELSSGNLYVHLLTPDQGLVSCFAKGAERQRSPLKNLCQVYRLVEFELFQGRKTLSLDGGTVIFPFTSLQKDPIRLAAAAHGADLALEILRDQSEANWIYPLLTYYFYALDRAERSLEQLIATFGYRLLAEAGFEPYLSRDLATDEVIPDEALQKSAYLYDRGKAALIPRAKATRGFCDPIYQSGQGASYLPMSATLRKLLNYIAQAPVERLFEIQMNDAMTSQLEAFVTPVLKDQMEQPLTRLGVLSELQDLAEEAAKIVPRRSPPTSEHIAETSESKLKRIENEHTTRIGKDEEEASDGFNQRTN